MDRGSTLHLIKEFVKTESLMRHLIGVEAAMGGYARKLGEDEDRYCRAEPNHR